MPKRELLFARINFVPQLQFANNNVPTVQDNVEVLGEEIPHCDTFSWKFPVEISQSTLDGRNGSSACSVIALIFAHQVWHGRLNLQRTPSLSPLWVMLLCSSIKVGNRLYDCCRQSLPQRFLSASEAATVAEQCSVYRWRYEFVMTMRLQL